MKREFKRQIVDLLNDHRIMTIATNRDDGWPQATVVSYVNDGLIIYCLTSRDTQKFHNIMRDPKGFAGHRQGLSATAANQGLSIAAHAVEVRR